MGKKFLTYNQQMRKLRDDKKIQCDDDDKLILIKNGYFNLVNGYKTPFIITKNDNQHEYINGINLKQLYSLKKFDESIRILFLEHLTKIEEEIRVIFAYSFDLHNSNGDIPWYDMKAFNPKSNSKELLDLQTMIFTDLKNSQQKYIKYYLDHHDKLPTWIVTKVLNFNTIIKMIKNSKNEIIDKLTAVYNFREIKKTVASKQLAAGLHLLRKIRNSAAHNEVIYNYSSINIKNRKRNINRTNNHIIQYLGIKYSNTPNKILDLLIYFRYFLADSDFNNVINIFTSLLIELQNGIHNQAYTKVLNLMGISNTERIDKLKKFKINKNYKIL